MSSRTQIIYQIFFFFNVVPTAADSVKRNLMKQKLSDTTISKGPVIASHKKRNDSVSKISIIFLNINNVDILLLLNIYLCNFIYYAILLIFLY